MSLMLGSSEYGPVVVRHGKTRLRIGYYDDDEYDPRRRRDMAIVYFCEPPLLTTSTCELVDYSKLSPIDTDALLTRHHQLHQFLHAAIRADSTGQRRITDYKPLYELSLELTYVSSLLTERMIDARMNEGRVGGRRVFISHSSLDKQVATWLSVDLANESHEPWLDEWEIRAGESIPSKIAHGIDQCDYLLVLLSPHAVASGWVEREWQAKYWSEVQEGRVRVIPVLLADCTVPTLLRTKKYADFRSAYRDGLEQVLDAIGRRDD